jgi:hypothetical protein
MRRLAALLVVLAAVAAIAPVASAQRERYTAEQLATALAGKPAFVQPGLDPRPDGAALTAVARETPSTYLVILARQVQGAKTAKQSARLITAALQEQDPNATVGLVVGKRLAGASLSRPQARVDQAVADAGTVAAEDPVGALTSYAAAVSKPVVDDAGDAAGAGGGRPWWQWAILGILVVGIALVVLRIRARSHEQRRRRRGGSIWTAREFHGERLEALAARHATLTGETTMEVDDAEAAEHLQTAGARLLALRRTLPALTSPRELRTCAGELDAVEWEILWVEHRLAGHAPPLPINRGFPGLCFFSHEHGLGTEPIEVRRPDGTVAVVYVSPANKLALDRGDAPEVSLVHVGSRMIPWPAAPSWYGAYGWTADDLPGLEYEGEQIWGVDGPERDEDPFAEPSGEFAEPSDDVEAPTGIGEAEGEGEEPTTAWEPEPADDAPAPAEEATSAEPAARWLAPEEREPSAEAAVPEPPAPSATAEPTSGGFEELDAPPPAGLIAEPDDADEDPLPPPPPALASADAEDTLAGAPGGGDPTLAWDPFSDEPHPDDQPER